MNRSELAERISSRFSLRTSVSGNILDLISEEIAKELSDGERVYLQKLGAFHAVTRKARRYYDPRTKRIKTKPAHKYVIFRPGKQLLRRVGRATAKHK